MLANRKARLANVYVGHIILSEALGRFGVEEIDERRSDILFRKPQQIVASEPRRTSKLAIVRTVELASNATQP